MKWFNEKEFVCRCCGELPPSIRENIEALVHEVLDPARDRYGKPIIVNSGYRCPKHNKEEGGVANSQHLRGEAADIRPSTNSGTDLARLRQLIINSQWFDQLIIYPTFLHVSWKRNGVNRHKILRKVGNGYQPVTRKEVLAL